jgi:hypothetical protein
MRIRYNYIFIPILIIAGLAVWFLSTREKKEEAAKRLSDRALVDTAKIDVIELIRPDQSIRLEKTASAQKDSTGIWKMTSPYAVDGNAEATAKLIDAIMKVESERDLTGVTSEQLTEYGLDNPALKVKLASSDGTVLMDLSLGKDNAQGTDRYGALAGKESTAFLIPSYFIKDLDLTSEQLRDTHADAFDSASLVSIQLSSAKADIVLENRSGNWFVTKPDLFPASPARMDVLFHDLTELAATEFLPSSTTAPELAVNGASASWKSSDGKAGWLKLHGEDIKKGIYATSSHQPTPFLVEAYIVERISLAPDVFFHVLMIDVAPEKIQRVLLRQPSAENLEIARAGEGKDEWRILRPADLLIVDTGNYARYMRALLALQPGKNIPPPSHASDYGFEPVYFIKIEVYTDGKDPQSVIYIGKQDENGDYYSTQDRQTYFLMKKDLVDSYIAAADKLRNAKAPEKPK